MTDIDVSVALPPSFESAQHIATAEKLGYRRAYLYDTPFEGDDLARLAPRRRADHDD
jgi:5,10-methylenetetrahydromethanopterin reductase